MLKALELTGFKSFADKTRFEFPAGITVVVGPNGSGKSNIVDAIKWVLGEQSAKSLRGKEMSDVIFKGAGGANGRKPANSATATIFLDNSDRKFAFDADEIHISRRVYRSGEAEYLINGETCRLKDIRNMFRGTGIGTDAYSLIEQGKVDQLLQASAKDRRAIFEEAAGISRFKAKKVEALRRLARVDGNLIRLADIVEEVGSRYRSVKSQASKAARYKDYSQRLQELRTYVGMKDWRSFSEKIEKIAADNRQFAEKSESLKQHIAKNESESKEVDQQLDELSGKHIRQQEAVTTIREQIAQQKSNISLNQSRLDDILARRQQLETQISESDARTHAFQQRIEIAATEFQQSELALQQSTKELQQLDSELTQLDGQIEQLHLGNQAKREESTQLIGLITELGRLVSGADSQVDTLTARKSQLLGDVAKLEQALAARKQEYRRHVDEKTNLETQAESKDTALAQARSKCNEAKQSRIQFERNLSRIASEFAGKSQRANVLQELEKRLEGVNAGAKQLLEQARTETSGPLKDIIGVVADLVSVNVQHAGIVDVALGNAAQYIVLDGHELLDLLASEKLKVKGRVGFIQLDSPTTLGADPNVNVNGQAGVIGRADRLVQVNAQYAPFIRQLLGGTWVVKSLADAISLYERRLGHVRFVTLDGEIVESDGTVIVGPKAIVTGLVSRRSELRLLHREIQELEELQKSTSKHLGEITAQEEQYDEQVQILINENSKLASLLSDKSVRAAEAEKQIAEITEKLDELHREKDETVGSLDSITVQLAANRSQLIATEQRLTSLQSLVSDNESKVEQLRRSRGECEQRITIAKVKLAKSEQQLETLNARRSQDAQQFEQLQTELQRQKAQLESDRQSQQTSQDEIKSGDQKLNQFETERATFEQLLETLTTKRTELETLRKKTAQALRARRDELRQFEDRLHQAELKTDRLKMERDQIALRLQEDYGINIAEVEARLADETALAERESIDTEITDLRKKIGAIGAVNLDALAELEELEARYMSMEQQYQDLVQAKQQLESIIQRINSDSRRLFIETVDAIRGNFQRLFRQTFGGGQADIILEEGIDPLEAGVEIVATPPGKPQFNNSLLSGGEKALTAVSLLMAIFQFRPSPFCVLDEVDAPFDEANIGRFIEVLKSFLGWTKFVIVTHSKKTMTAATTLYGVTMQESGVSKRVSVRFEDVSEDGQISEEALNRSEDSEERGVA